MHERCTRETSGTSPANYMKFFYVYVLKSIHKDFLYVGFTNDLKHRFLEHNNKEELSTKAYAPFDLIHYEAYRSEKDAKRRENYFKTTKGRAVLKNMLKSYFSVTRIQKKTKPENAQVCPVCEGEGEVWKSSQFYSGYTNLGMCMTCKGKGWLVY